MYLTGFSILYIVRCNPKTLTVHFGGKRGRKIRENYLVMETELTLPNGTIVKTPILSGLTHESKSYTFSESRGLLFSTQFAQPAILLLQKATFEDMRARGLIQQNAIYGGHSLGEYGSLASFSGFMSTKTLMDVVFYRGLTMQVAMERDEHGETNFSMVAVNPKRVGKCTLSNHPDFTFLVANTNTVFDEAALSCVVKIIATESKNLLEIVNYNIEGEQYVCTGTVRDILLIPIYSVC